MRKTCATCLFAEDFEGYLYCHRMPPVAYYDEGGSMEPRFAPTEPDLWCGEHRQAYGSQQPKPE